MLKTLFSQLCELEGVNHVRLMDQFGSVLQSTTKWPETSEEQRFEWAEYCRIAEELSLGTLFEVWTEGRRLTLFDRFDNDVYVHISGKGGKKGTWRYELERLRKNWNSKQPEAI
ncbi:MAG: hypothetical protein VXV89_00700 [Candidatus Thermoplasmatota archaeon]|jgi:hypothetical protein|nr:hypothetical protein [Candidatus Thermoplasmatota archaeon]